MAKKKNRDYDFDLEDQQAMLDNIDAFISGEANSASFAEEPEEKDNNEWMDEIGSILGFTNKPKQTNTNKSKSMDRDEFLNTVLDTSDFKPESVDKEDEPEYDNKNEKMFSVTWDKENSIVSLSDETRICDIDLNALTADDDVRYSEKFVSIEDMKANIKTDFAETVYNILTNFLPKAIFTKAKLLDVFRHIECFDETRFMFFEYPGEDDIILAYEMLDTSWEDIDEIIYTALERKCAISLLVAMESISTQDGISFRNYSEKTIKRLMLNKDYKENQDYFIENLYESAETETDKSVVNQSLDDVIEVGPFLGGEPAYKSVASKLHDEIKNVGAEKIQVSSLYGEIRKPEPEDDNTEIDDVDETVKVEISTEESIEIEIPSDEDDEVELPEMQESTEEVSEIEIPEDEEEMDHDEAEELYFGSKKPRTSMKSSKKSSDDEFVVTRRK